MTTAQKNAKAKFKQAIEYRKKTGVSLKEAFAHIYGKKKVGSVAKKTVKKKKAKLTTEDKKDKSAFNAMARKHKKARVGALKLKPNEMRLGLLSSKVGATVKSKKAKKPSEQSILNKIHIVKEGVNKLDEAQHKHMMGKIGKVHNYNLIALKGALSQLKDLETHLAILKNVKPKIVKTQLPVIRREIKNTVNSIKEIKIHITQLKKYI
jgi:hypothetical protein